MNRHATARAARQSSGARVRTPRAVSAILAPVRWGLVLAVALLVGCSDMGDCKQGENRICVGDDCICGPRCGSADSCIPGQDCAENISGGSACIAAGFLNGNYPECKSGQQATINNCGGEGCSCADSCNTNEECRSLCCVDGKCALPCVCDGDGEAYPCGPQ